MPHGPEAELGLIQHTLDIDRSILFGSDTEGLNLNITIPEGTSDHDKLPVFLFIHGGGFMVGSATWPQYDMSKFVQLGKSKGVPCIAVNFNYRLGAAGLLTSKELHDAGYVANNAIRDQRTAMLWVKKYIGGFGGDPENVTLAGESAGAASCSYHLQSEQPLFKRIVLMSGSDLLIPPIPVEAAEKNYENAIKALGLESQPATERVEALLKMDGLSLLSDTKAPMLPVIDDELPLKPQSFDDFNTRKLNLPGTQWCKAIMVGDCQFDGFIQFLRLMHRKHGIGAAFCNSIQVSFSSGDTAVKLLSAYGITTDLDDDTAFFKVLEVANDVCFYAPTVAYAQGLSKHMKTYMYRFNEPNPWEGQWKGHATHILDVAFLFQNFNEFLDQPQQQLAEEFAVKMLSFAHGSEPWEAWTGEKRVAEVFGPQGKVQMLEDEPDKVGRRKVLFELAAEVEGGMDRIVEAFNEFMRGPPVT